MSPERWQQIERIFLEAVEIDDRAMRLRFLKENCGADDELQREVEKLKKAEYISYHVGEIFDGVISGVTGFGIYVQLENTVEGLVRIDELRDDYYDYHKEKYALEGRRTGNVYRLGDEVRVIVDHVDLEKHEIDFLIAGHL